MNIREAVPGDAAGIARVHVDSWRSTYRGIIPDDHLASLSYEKRTENWKINLATPGEFTFVVEDPAYGIAGFASGGRERTENPEFTGELYAIYLLDSHRGRGAGRLLVRETARRLLLMGYPSMLAWVLEENPACAFYAALGACRAGDRTEIVGGKSLHELCYGWKDIREPAGIPHGACS